MAPKPPIVRSAPASRGAPLDRVRSGGSGLETASRLPHRSERAGEAVALLCTVPKWPRPGAPDMAAGRRASDAAGGAGRLQAEGLFTRVGTWRQRFHALSTFELPVCDGRPLGGRSAVR